MVRIAPVRLPFNPKTLWFDALDLDLSDGDDVIVLTARGLEYGHLDGEVFEPTPEQISKLKSPLKPVRRIATDEDVERAVKLERKSREAMPVFRELAEKKAPEMNPISVEFLFDGDKAVFYFESDERIDFRDLVRDLAGKFHVRVDMKQIGVRDEARMVGGLGHCGQELCCCRMGGDFNPVSIRMAKEQGLSLNPQKISGLCGRLMCCLRYEYDAYKDFHGRAPKKNAKISTPDGEGKVVDMDVPRETISIVVGDEKPVSVPLADMETEGDGNRPNAVGEDAWERAHSAKEDDRLGALSLLTSQFTEKDKLADPTEVRRVGSGKKRSGSGSSQSSRSGSSSRSGRSRGKQQNEPAPVQHKTRRRRSTKVGADGSTSTVEGELQQNRNAAASTGGDKAGERSSSNRRRRRGGRGQGGSSRGDGAAPQATGSQGAVAPGRKSSALRTRGEAGRQGVDAKNPSEDGRSRASQGGKSDEGKPGGRTPRRRGSRGGSRNSGGNGSANSGSANAGATNAASAGGSGAGNASAGGSGSKAGQGEGSSSRRRPRRRSHRSSGGGQQGQGGSAGSGSQGGSNGGE